MRIFYWVVMVFSTFMLVAAVAGLAGAFEVRHWAQPVSWIFLSLANGFSVSALRINEKNLRMIRDE